jgi:hypothetical protein
MSVARTAAVLTVADCRATRYGFAARFGLNVIIRVVGLNLPANVLKLG